MFHYPQLTLPTPHTHCTALTALTALYTNSTHSPIVNFFLSDNVVSGMSDKDASTIRVIEELKRIYKTKILPLEKMYMFDMFFSPFMSDAEFDAKPQVMLIGQYSVGKTTFIRLVECEDLVECSYIYIMCVN